MDLNSTKDMLLLRNCIILQIKILNLNLEKSNSSNFSQIKNTIDMYTRLLNHLNVGDFENATNIIKSSSTTDVFSDFSKYISSTPPKKVASEILDSFKKELQESNLYSEESFKKVEDAFYKGNEELLKSKSVSEYEEEPESEIFYHLTDDIQNTLNLLDDLIKKALKQTSPDEFKLFCIQYKILVKDLGIKKFQQYFDEKNQDIIDMQISFNTQQKTRPLYQIDFTLLNDEHSEEKLSIKEPAKEAIFILDYYQTLCYAYLESQKNALLDNSEITPGFINEELNNFVECYKKLVDMSKYKINIGFNSKVIFSSKSLVEPSELDLDSCEE